MIRVGATVRARVFVSCLILLVHVDDLLEVEAEDDDDRLVEGGRGARLLDVARQQVVEQAPLLPPAQAAVDEQDKKEEKRGEHHFDCGLIDQCTACLKALQGTRQNTARCHIPASIDFTPYFTKKAISSNQINV